MACVWNNIDSDPPVGVTLLVKYNPFRSDTPFRYVVARFDVAWMTYYIESDGRVMEGIIPKPDFWALIESEEYHG